MKQRATIILVFAVFLAPVLLATLMHSQWWRFEPETKNYGQLIEPVIALDDFQVVDSQGQTWRQDAFLEHWTLLAVSNEPCAQNCVDRLTWLARLRETQGRHLQRLNVMVVGSELLDTDAPPAQPGIILASSTLTVDQTRKAQAEWVNTLPHDLNLKTTYLIDPVGNIIMSYPADSDPTGIRKDLKRILTWSKADAA